MNRNNSIRTRNRNNIELSILSEEEWINYFRMFDHDNDDRIPTSEFLEELKTFNGENIPILTIENALRMADTNRDNIITLEEFLRLVKLAGPGGNKSASRFIKYVRTTIPPRKPILLRKERRPCELDLEEYRTTVTDGEYEDEYRFCPPPLTMAIISLLEAAAFLYDMITTGYGSFSGHVATIFIYNPHRRIEVWRFLTYMFVHSGAQHLLSNILVQIMLGLPLEMVHGWWRILIIYIAGVTAGSLGTSVLDPEVYLAGASGGVYALLTAHLATVIMNWSEMEYGVWQLLVILTFCIADTGTAIYYRYVLDLNTQIGYEAHFTGALAGLLVGINVLRNLEVRPWEKKAWWVAVFIYFILIAIGIAINISLPSHFPKQYTK